MMVYVALSENGMHPKYHVSSALSKFNGKTLEVSCSYPHFFGHREQDLVAGAIMIHCQERDEWRAFLEVAETFMHGVGLQIVDTCGYPKMECRMRKIYENMGK